MAIDKVFIGQLLADYKKPKDIIGENGLLKHALKPSWSEPCRQLTDRLGFEKHDPAGHHRGNTRNGTAEKFSRGTLGNWSWRPADRQASFEPKIVAQGQIRFTGFDDTIISMYARSMSTREIQGHLEGEIEKLYLEATALFDRLCSKSH